MEAHVINWYKSTSPRLKLDELINGWMRANRHRRVVMVAQSESFEGISNLHVTVTLFHVEA